MACRAGASPALLLLLATGCAGPHLGAERLARLDSAAGVRWTASLAAGSTALCPLVNVSTSGASPRACTAMTHPTPHPAVSGLAATVPGEIVTDLQNAGLIADPLTDVNWLNSSAAALWGASGWVYEAKFPTPPLAGSAARLVFESVKMGATVHLNGRPLGAVRSQFLRYTFDVGSALAADGGTNHLAVNFTDIDPHGRYAACTGGDDWAPYTATLDPHDSLPGLNTSHTFTRGIVKGVYLASGSGPSAAMIERLTPLVHYLGEYPTRPLEAATAGPWRVVVSVHMLSKGGGSGRLSVRGSWASDAENSTSVALRSGTTSATLTLSAEHPQLWWPAGFGAQTLYSVDASFTPDGGAAAVNASARVGFRYAVLVTVSSTPAEESARASSV